MELSEQQICEQWQGRKQTEQDIISLRPVLLMQALLNKDPSAKIGDPLPPLWHWLYYPTFSSMAELGDDGHPQKGGFLPPVALPRRMWAGGRLTFLKPIPIGSNLHKESITKNIEFKQGKSGQLCFVLVQHQFSINQEVVLIEEHDIVYKEAKTNLTQTLTPSPPLSQAEFQQTIHPHPTMLFRYSSLTYNGHRIHYDRSYATEVEGYEGLIFHGPLTATLLVDMCLEQMPKYNLSKFEFKATSPLYDTAPFIIAGEKNDDNSLQVWAQNPHGYLSMTGQAKFN